MSALIHCIYSSVATRQFSEDQLPQLLAHSQAANRRRDITGMLVYINQNFLQVVEGRADAVDALLKKIEADRRHSRIFMLAREPIEKRSFDSWSMGFEALLPSEVGNLAGENDFFDTGSCLSALNAGIVKTILHSFRNTQTESV